MQFLKKIDKVLTLFEEWSLFLFCAVSLVALFFNIILRYTIHYSLDWAEELIRITIIYTTLIGASVALKNKSMIKIDAVMQFFPKTKPVLEFISHTAFIIFSIILIYYGALLVKQMHITNQTTIIMGIPLFILYLTIPITGFLILMRTIHSIIIKN